jgi:hypothetical protein
MRCFAAVKCVLDEAYSQIDAPTDGEKDMRICAALAQLQKDYSDLTKARVVDYSDPVTRFAYVFKYVTSHANIVEQIISGARCLSELLAKPELYLACIGGGPGSDLLGAVKHLEKQKVKTRLTCEMFDRETAWGETWGHLSNQVDFDGVNLRSAFMTFDVTEVETWRKFSRFHGADLFTMVYFMSEVYHLRQRAEPFFANMMSKAKQGSFFLFVDNGSANGKPLFSEWFDELAAMNGISTLRQGDNERFVVSGDEEKTELEPYFSRFSSPKLQTWISWRIARKEG